MKKLITLFILSTLFISCTIKPQEINYGEDTCHYCSMTIVDRQHAAQLVTDKGKVYKFDAAECMIHQLSETTTPIALYLVTDYSTPESLIDAEKATFIISPNIPSPMKANLSALAKREDAISLQEEKDGELFTWEELLKHLNN